MIEGGADESVQPPPSLPAFVATVVVVTASGALMPGPLFAANILQGTTGGAKSGFMMSVGHTIVELPLVLLIALGVASMMGSPGFFTAVGIIGGGALIAFGVLQVRDIALHSPAVRPSQGTKLERRSLILGIVLSSLNPFFIVWWLTVGLGLIVQAVELGALVGVLFMFVTHVWMDYAWLTGTAYLSARGKTLLGTRGYRVLLVVLGLLLIYFGVGFVARTVFQLNILP